MTQQEPPPSPDARELAPPVEQAPRTTDATLVDAWQALGKTVGFALAADDYEVAWLDRLSKLLVRLRELTAKNPDLSLYMMLQAATGPIENYSAHHAVFCAVVGDLCSSYLEWPEAEAQALQRAALTMNLGMQLQQNAMALQLEPLSSAQRARVEEHPAKSVELLHKAGVTDALWLETVRRHHRPIDEGESSDPLTAPQRLAQLLQRIDVFTAKLSRRKTRAGASATVAARNACLGASGVPDATGATMLRVLGLYPPGTFVRLAGGETGVVTRRGNKAHTPIVASLRRNDGGLYSQPILRDTSEPNRAVQRSLSAEEAKIRLEHRRIWSAKG